MIKHVTTDIKAYIMETFRCCQTCQSNLTVHMSHVSQKMMTGSAKLSTIHNLSKNPPSFSCQYRKNDKESKTSFQNFWREFWNAHICHMTDENYCFTAHCLLLFYCFTVLLHIITRFLLNFILWQTFRPSALCSALSWFEHPCIYILLKTSAHDHQTGSWGSRNGVKP